jgi:hypothetical protein
MKKTLTAIMFVAAAAFTAQAQTADEVINNYFEVIGGREAMAKVKNTEMIATIKMQGMELPATMVNTADGKMKMSVNFQGMEFVQPSFDGETGWQTNMTNMQPEKMDDQTNAITKDQAADFPDPFLNYKEKGYTVVLEGEETIEGVDTYKVKLVKKPLMIDGKEVENFTYYFFDKDSGVQIMTRSESQFGPAKGMTVESFMSDYQEVEGIYFPFSIEQKVNGQSQMSIVVDKIELNKEVDNTMFAFPK